LTYSFRPRLPERVLGVARWCQRAACCAFGAAVSWACAEDSDWEPSAQCPIADTAKVETAEATALQLNALSDELGSMLTAACRTIAEDLGHVTLPATAQDDVERVALACDAAINVLSDWTANGMSVKADPPICLAPSETPSCRASCSPEPDDECADLCAATASMQVECGQARVNVTTSIAVAGAVLETQLGNVLVAYQRSGAAITAASDYNDVVSRWVREPTACDSGLDELSYNVADTSMLQTVLVMSGQFVTIIEQ
jgi:hypothetical protein